MLEHEIIYCDDCGEPILEGEDIMCLPMGYYHKKCLRSGLQTSGLQNSKRMPLRTRGSEI